MAQPASDLAYARALRALGQALEEQGITEFELRVEGDAHIVRGVRVPPQSESPPTPTSQQEAPAGGLGGLLRGLFGQRREQARPQTPAGPREHGTASEPTIVELRYTLDDLERLDREGQARRRDPSGMPDAYRLSQLLRVVGAQLDTVEGHLLALARHGPTIAVEYEPPDGQHHRDERTVAALYEAWVRMYLRRSERPPT